MEHVIKLEMPVLVLGACQKKDYHTFTQTSCLENSSYAEKLTKFLPWYIQTGSVAYFMISFTKNDLGCHVLRFGFEYMQSKYVTDDR